MKKLVKCLLCFVVLVSAGLMFSACGEDKTPAKKDISVTVSVSSEEVYAYGDLPAISATATADGSSVAGVVVWNANQTVTTNKTSYEWTFTPNDTNAYNTATGSKTLTVKKSDPNPKVTAFDFDVDTKLGNNSLEFLVNGKAVSGSIEWSEHSFSRAELGQTKTVQFTFAPTDADNLNIVTGEVDITLKATPKLISANVYDAGVVGTSIENIKNQMKFEDRNLKDISGTCTIKETEIVLGKNILHYSFEPQNTDIYLSTSGIFNFVSFKTQSGVYLVERADQLTALAGILSSSSFRLDADLTVSLSDINDYYLSTAAITPHKVASSGIFSGIFDGNNKSITIDASTCETRVALFEKLSDATIENLNIVGNGEVVLASLVEGSNITMLDSVKISGKAENASEGYAPFVSLISNGANIMFNNCTSAYNISGETVSAFVGVANNAPIIRFTDCIISGNISGETVGLFVSNSNVSNVDLQPGNENHGTIEATKLVSLSGINDGSLLDEFGDIISNISPDNFFNSGSITLKK